MKKFDIFAKKFTMLDKKQISRISKALGDPYRLRIMEEIKKQEDGCWLQCVTVIGMLDLAQSTVSHHIKQLVDADLLVAEKDGRNAKYKVNKEVFGEYIQFLSPFKG